MSIFASRTQQTIPLPFDAPHTVTIRRLAGRHLEHARATSRAASIKTLKAMGGMGGFRQELGAIGDAEKVAELVAKQQADPLAGLDRYVVLAKGIVTWTYDESLTPVAVTDDDGAVVMRILAIDDLDDAAADFLARAIAALSPARGDEAARKNALSLSPVA